MQIAIKGKHECQICHKVTDDGELILGSMVREGIVDVIRKEIPDWSDQGYICEHDLNRFKEIYVEQSIESEKGELSKLESEIVKAIGEQNLVSQNVNTVYETKLSFGDNLADKVADFGGSWKFIILYLVILLIWISANSVLYFTRHFDPFPFILLNLMLGILSALQAPFIMMSQNRQESKDRLRAENDYKVNLKAELEIRALTEKMDHLLNQQWQRLLEIQEIQTGLLEETLRKKE